MSHEEKKKVVAFVVDHTFFVQTVRFFGTLAQKRIVRVFCAPFFFGWPCRSIFKKKSLCKMNGFGAAVVVAFFLIEKVIFGQGMLWLCLGPPSA